MVQGVREDDWWHTCSINAITLELNRDRKKRSTPITAEELHPFLDKKKGKDKAAEIEKVPVSELKALFTNVNISD